MLRHTTSSIKCTAFVAFSRCISIQQPSVSPFIKVGSSDGGEVSDNVTSLEVAKEEKSAIEFTKDEPVFTALGNPQSTLSLTVPPSIPIYVKRGSLMSLFAASSGAKIDSTVTSNLKILHPLRRFFNGGITSTYQRLLSTVPLNLLVSAYPKGGILSTITGNSTKIESTKTFCNIAMDGTMDWALFQPNSLHVYTGNTLLITSQKFPKKTTVLAPKKKKVDTGLSSFFQPGYSRITGRGYISLVGSGSIFKLGLAENEEVYIKKGNVLASTIRDSTEFSSGYFIAEQLNNKTFEQRKSEEEKLENRQSEINLLTERTEDYTPNFLDKLESWIMKLTTSISKSSGRVARNIAGNGSYIKVKGPRMLLIQTGSGEDQFIYNSITRRSKKFGSSIEDSERFVKKERDLTRPETSNGDNLSIVTIKSDGTVTHRNTEDFSDEVSRIEKLGSK
ncbi:DEKNAAC102024 [Brettanomyces naardenensis]|uniref:Altered inheritance of mitochondria protein 24, mitochondrial n=1 Tax=Brettanomyces naardenensis TaxID=13370 RepID=A0A448YJD0_BRENA|nr:DEKNAAC102024 [Brettanomyces naardenensis]